MKKGTRRTRGPTECGALLRLQGSHGSLGWAGTVPAPRAASTAGVRLNEAASAFQGPTTRSGRIMEGWEGPYTRSRDSVQILVLPPNEPVTSHGLSRPESPLIENTESWPLRPPSALRSPWDLVTSQG